MADTYVNVGDNYDVNLHNFISAHAVGVRTGADAIGVIVTERLSQLKEDFTDSLGGD